MKILLTFGAIGVAGLAVGGYVALGPGRLIYGDKTVSTTFIVQNGKTYVPVEDVASALDCVVQKTGDTLTLAPIGKGKMVEGVIGKIGQTIGRPELQFTVRSLKAADHYQRQYSDGALDGDDNNQLIILLCRVRNGTSRTVNICTLGGSKTALTDMDEHSYEVMTGDGPRNVDILPGAVSDFGIIFRVPKSEKLKALVYQTDGFPQVETFRVSVADADAGSSG